ncbi:MAG: molybdopterin molybdotransferase MoeA [Chloroflexi bacterium]|nr:molybdopterin molybdotransferase MoeA [Chloroflexota bacterium]
MSTDPLPPLRLEEARARMLAGVGALAAETVPLLDALERVLAEDVHARDTLPPWDDSAMDGYAVRAADTSAAQRDRPVVLRVVGEVAAGHTAAGSVEPGTAQRILTGAMLPPGADAVVRVEDTDAPAGTAALPERVAIHVPVGVGASIRVAGSDVRAGDLVAAAGTRLTAHRIGAMAAAGRAQVAVHRRPRVAVLATGDELVPPGTPLDGGRITDSSSSGVAAQVMDAGGVPVALGIAADDRGSIRDRLRAGIETADIVVVCGGVSLGAHDEVRPALDEVGRVDLWRVAIQPGKPLAFGRATSTDGRTVLLFGLPGNPVSSFVTFELFVRPVLHRMAGRSGAGGRTIIRARLTDPVSTDGARRAFQRVTLERGTDGGTQARLSGGQGSHVLSALLAANGLAIVPEGIAELPAGAEVEVMVLDDPGWPEEEG